MSELKDGGITISDSCLLLNSAKIIDLNFREILTNTKVTDTFLKEKNGNYGSAANREA